MKLLQIVEPQNKKFDLYSLMSEIGNLESIFKGLSFPKFGCDTFEQFESMLRSKSPRFFDSGNILELLFSARIASTDYVLIDVADYLLENGYHFPEDFQRNCEKIFGLIDFYYLTRMMPDLINEPKFGDFNGTPVHCAAKNTMDGTNRQSLIWYVLKTCKTKKPDLSIKDGNGNTPVHVVAEYSNDRDIHDSTFRAMIDYAVRTGYDFSTTNNRGYTIFHILAIKIVADDSAQRVIRRPLNSFFEIINSHNVTIDPIILNKLSNSGATAIFYALNHCIPANVLQLIELGADPYLYGNPEKDPLKMLEHIEDLYHPASGEYEKPDQFSERLKKVIELSRASQASNASD